MCRSYPKRIIHVSPLLPSGKLKSVKVQHTKLCLGLIQWVYIFCCNVTRERRWPNYIVMKSLNACRYLLTFLRVCYCYFCGDANHTSITITFKIIMFGRYSKLILTLDICTCQEEYRHAVVKTKKKIPSKGECSAHNRLTRD